MTVNTNYDSDPLDDEELLGRNQAVPVIEIGKKYEQLAPQFGACSLFNIPLAGTSPPVQILQRRPTRDQAYVFNYDSANDIVIAENPGKLQSGNIQGYIIPPGKESKLESQEPYWAIAANAGDVGSFDTIGGQGAVTGPTTGAVIAQIPATKLLEGVYQVTGTYYADGTLTAAEADNFKLVAKGVTISNLNYPQAGGVQSFGPYYVDFFASGPTNISIQAVNNAGVAAVYHAELVATPYPFTPQQNINTSVLVGVRDEAWLQNTVNSD
jgi:hypothetical protein